MTEQNLTHNTLPHGVTQLLKEVSELKRLLIEKQEQSTTEKPEQWLDLEDLIRYDPEKRKKSTWYSKISKGDTPSYHKRGKKIYFLKVDVDNWLKAGKRKSNAEIEAEAEAYLSNNKKGLK